MVKPWQEARKKGIALTKYRIAHMEKHGVGNTAIEEKRILVKQQRKSKDNGERKQQ